MDQIQEKEDSVLSVSDAVLFAKNEVASMPSMTVVGGYCLVKDLCC